MASAMDRRFEIAEQKLKRQERQREQEEREALKRRFASIGALGSGASIKAEEQAAERAGKRLSEGKLGIESQRLAEQARQEEIEGQRAFQRGEREASQLFARGEREAGQGFAAEQSALGRRFATGEREAGQRFATGEREAGQRFAAGEREAGQTFATGQLEKSQAFAAEQAAKQEKLTRDLEDAKNKIAEMGLKLQKDELELNEITTFFNMDNAPMVEKLMGERYGTGETGGDAGTAPNITQTRDEIEAKQFKPVAFLGGGSEDRQRVGQINQRLAAALKMYQNARIHNDQEGMNRALAEARNARGG